MVNDDIIHNGHALKKINNLINIELVCFGSAVSTTNFMNPKTQRNI